MSALSAAPHRIQLATSMTWTLGNQYLSISLTIGRDRQAAAAVYQAMLEDCFACGHGMQEHGKVHTFCSAPGCLCMRIGLHGTR